MGICFETLKSEPDFVCKLWATPERAEEALRGLRTGFFLETKIEGAIDTIDLFVFLGIFLSTEQEEEVVTVVRGWALKVVTEVVEGVVSGVTFFRGLLTRGFDFFETFAGTGLRAELAAMAMATVSREPADDFEARRFPDWEVREISVEVRVLVMHFSAADDFPADPETGFFEEAAAARRRAQVKEAVLAEFEGFEGFWVEDGDNEEEDEEGLGRRGR